MNILVIGSGAREHAIIKKLNEDKDRIDNIYCMGNNKNPGILKIVSNFSFFNNIDETIKYAKEKKINMAVIGPEKYLEMGLANVFKENQIQCIGPSKEMARIETDKLFARNILPSKYNPKFQFFETLETHKQISSFYNFVKSMDFDYVIKPTKLCSGKGVKVSGQHFENDLEGFLYAKEMAPVLIEEKLIGKEFTLMCYSDGKNIKNMPVVLDYKLLEEGNKGPNTGSMGCITYRNHSAPFLDDKDIDEARKINKNIVETLQNINDLGYKGILYGSFIKCEDGIKVIEYNARYGDPEAVNAIGLLDSSLLDIFVSISEGTLDNLNIRYKENNIVSKYVVPDFYPFKNRKQNKLDNIYRYEIEKEWYNSHSENIICSGLNLFNNKIIATNSRSFVYFKVCELEMPELCDEINNVLCNAPLKLFKFRRDIGKENENENEKSTYKDSGVDIEHANDIVKQFSKMVGKTLDSNCIHNENDFGGIIRVPSCYKKPVLVSSIDGVGSKSSFFNTLIEKNMADDNIFYNNGVDIVSHSINDILVKGANPFFFLDYLATDRLEKNKIIETVRGMTDMCSKYNISLVGGETAEMPHVYSKKELDIAGCIVGIMEEENIIDGKKNINYDDVVVGLYSGGLHTNGYSLIRHLWPQIEEKMNTFDEENRGEFVKWLCEPHRCYYNEINLLSDIKINGLIHITGGGFIDNPKRVLSDDKTMVLYKDCIFNKYFRTIQEIGDIDETEMLRTFNCGIGMLIVIDKDNFEHLQKIYKENGIEYCNIGFVKKKENEIVEFF